MNPNSELKPQVEPVEGVSREAKICTISDGKIIRAGFTSNAFMAGSAKVDISGTFCRADVEDLLALLEMVTRNVRRQGNV